MARPVDHQRRADLLEAAVTYVIDTGLADLSLRPVAAALGVSTTTLVHHFGTKDELLEAILNRVRERIMEATNGSRNPDGDVADLLREAWAWSSDPRHERLFRLFYEIYGRALQKPEHFEQFLDRVIADWLGTFMAALERTEHDPATHRTQATLAIAVFRGLLLDLLTTGDSERVNAAFDAFIAGLGRPAGSDAGSA